ncbi:carboxymuconolactone decarboxylase family protein [Microbacterium sp. zg.B48]|uniref:carboxymuconolactone decarboxylase family protein n=1 Tax=unclassified Microbacterium TaxID=2609290 RepID=UPI00214AE172|nr:MULTISPECIES: carboxymuconolactone decarboxylase family protein [unclassified Microbacterium]MCR2764015.1 carboxymuconolactone decarboxylase family protein [Microbacterium sp. zg.B48]MCR2810436.1 carboxymuconolactone decarboxylase family protein [Microbacterium sp. zg.B185]WIM18488.1 carboxymuconolactone decarboxylase family protein [Microbacterium sp. zg-B185]
MVIRDELYDIGMQQRRAMFGTQGAEARVDTTTDLNDKLEDFVTRTTFGDVWQRPGLSLAARSEVTFAMLLANGREHELRVHAEGALENGVSPIELREIVLQGLLYCGIPAGVLGVRVLREVFEARGIGDALDGEADATRAARSPASTRAES